ncbi:hypothetical protein PA598K_00341 [Paenibacillus sp. 598K]|uniref:stalk domain-containing protein n=1 Tax=Paenibacillus sp. 598K TaxID=1117987 RepID=UPI000FFAD0A0|nr:stalk domain-containing protein [Paenibacillus sp. 598K]GBF72105.1 hypothetical protein PA598K_00341 [Paenibacillus sp. 598K]
MKSKWTRTWLAAGLAFSLMTAPLAAVAAETPLYRSYTSHSLIKQDGTYWVWGDKQPVPVRIDGLGDVAAVYDGDLIRLVDGTVHYAGALLAGQPMTTVALPHFDNLKQAYATSTELFIIDSMGRLHLIPKQDGQLRLATLQDSQPLAAPAGIEQVSAYYEWYDNTSELTLIARTEDGSIWRSRAGAQRLADWTRIPDISDAIDIQDNLALTKTGELYSWTIRNTRELSVMQSTPGRPIPITGGVRWLQAHRLAHLAVDVDGRLWFWGHTVTGVSDSTLWHEQPEPIRFTTIDKVREAYIVERSLLVLTEGGQLYRTSMYRESMPHNPEFELLQEKVRSVQPGSRHLMIELQDGSLWGLGINKSFELGAGYSHFEQHTPIPLHKPVDVLLNNDPVPLRSGVMIRDGQAFIPLRSIFEQMGATLTWDASRKETTITRDASGATPAVSMLIRYASGEVLMQGRPIALANKPFIVEGVTYLPLRLVSETLGAQVHWSAEEQKIRIVHP